MTTAFYDIHSQGLVRVASCTPRVEVANPAVNAHHTLDLARRGHEQHVDLMLFPELGLSAYAIDDLLLQDALLARVEADSVLAVLQLRGEPLGLRAFHNQHAAVVQRHARAVNTDDRIGAFCCKVVDENAVAEPDDSLAPP